MTNPKSSGPDPAAMIDAIKKMPPAERQDLFRALVEGVGLFWKISYLQVLVDSIRSEATVYEFARDEITKIHAKAHTLEGLYYRWTNSETERRKRQRKSS